MMPFDPKSFRPFATPPSLSELECPEDAASCDCSYHENLKRAEATHVQLPARCRFDCPDPCIEHDPPPSLSTEMLARALRNHDRDVASAAETFRSSALELLRLAPPPQCSTADADAWLIETLLRRLLGGGCSQGQALLAAMMFGERRGRCIGGDE